MKKVLGNSPGDLPVAPLRQRNFLKEDSLGPWHRGIKNLLEGKTKKKVNIFLRSHPPGTHLCRMGSVPAQEQDEVWL